MVLSYCRDILRRRSAKAFKRFTEIRSENVSDIAKEAEILRKREFADKDLNRSDCSEFEDPEIFVRYFIL